MLSQLVHCAGAGASAASSSGGGGLGINWPVTLALMAGAALVALLSAGLTLIAARRLPPVPAPIPTWGETSPG